MRLPLCRRNRHRTSIRLLYIAHIDRMDCFLCTHQWRSRHTHYVGVEYIPRSIACTGTSHRNIGLSFYSVLLSRLQLKMTPSSEHHSAIPEETDSPAPRTAPVQIPPPAAATDSAPPPSRPSVPGHPSPAASCTSTDCRTPERGTCGSSSPPSAPPAPAGIGPD